MTPLAEIGPRPEDAGIHDGTSSPAPAIEPEQPLTPADHALLHIVAGRVGKAAAISAVDLCVAIRSHVADATGITEPHVRAMVRVLRKRQYLIGSCPAGYFMPADLGEVLEFVHDMLHEPARDLLHTATMQIRAARTKFGMQQTLPGVPTPHNSAALIVRRLARAGLTDTNEAIFWQDMGDTWSAQVRNDERRPHQIAVVRITGTMRSPLFMQGWADRLQHATTDVFGHPVAVQFA